MWKKTLMYLSVVGALYGCDFRNNETGRLQTQVDSLRAEVESNRITAEKLQEIGSLMDSIDASRSMLKTKMLRGTSFDDYALRMQDIKKYVMQAEQRLTALENDLSSSKNSASGYGGIITKFKRDLESRTQELAVVKGQVEKYHNQNANLVQTSSLQRDEITDKLTQLEVKHEEMVKLETQVKDLLAESKLNEAESYFTRARAVEESANRTRFAPRKKRETRKEALELYKMAALYGKEEAKPKITELEQEI